MDPSLRSYLESLAEMAFETFIHLYYFQGYFVINEIPRKEFPFSCVDGDMFLIFLLVCICPFVLFYILLHCKIGEQYPKVW